MTCDVAKLLVILMLTGLVCSGCGSGIQGAGSDAEAKYGWGTLEATLQYPLGSVYEAAQTATSDLDLEVLLSERDDLAGEILARDAQEETVTIRLEALPRARTKMVIRVDVLGDKNKSNVIFNEIVKNLGATG
jgi:hypothetical protein